MRDLASLIAALEQATGPSRELDAELGRRPIGWRERNGMFGREWISPAGRMAELPRYTESLDAARTLLPEGWFALIDTRGRADVRYAPIDQSGYRREVANAATPALALGVAALRARLAGRHK